MNTGKAVWENSMVDLNLELRSTVDPTLWKGEVDWRKFADRKLGTLCAN